MHSEIECLLIFLTGASKFIKKSKKINCFMSAISTSKQNIALSISNFERWNAYGWFTLNFPHIDVLLFLKVTGPNSVCLEIYKKIKWTFSSCCE